MAALRQFMWRAAVTRPALRHFRAKPSAAAAAGPQSGGVCFEHAANTGASISSAATTTPPTAMPEYKLIYFKGRGLAEVTRWMMHYGNIPFTDERIERVDWPERKKSIPGGRVPVLLVEGTTLSQSMAIARFVAMKVGLVPEDPLQAAICDDITETIKNMSLETFRIMNAEGKSEEENVENLNEDHIPNTLMPMLQLFEQRFTEKEWFLGDKMSWVDFTIAQGVERLIIDPRLAGLVTKFPKTKAHAERIMNLPGVKEYLEKRNEIYL